MNAITQQIPEAPIATTAKPAHKQGKLRIGGVIEAPPPEAPPPEPKPKSKKKQIPDNPVMMTPQQLRDILRELECNAPMLGRVLKANERTSRRWASGEVVIAPAIAGLIRHIVAVAREAPYAEIVAQLRREADLLEQWENQRLVAMAKRAAKEAQG